MVQGRRREVHHVFGEAVVGPDSRVRARRHADGTSRVGVLDPLGASRRAGRVQHRHALELFGQWRRRVSGNQVLEPFVAVDRPADDDRRLDRRRHHRDELADGIAQLRRDEHGLGVAVVEDVGDLLGVEVVVDRREVETRTLRGPDHLQVLGVVVHEDGDVVAEAQPAVVEQLRDAVGVVVELAVRHDLPGRTHDVRGLVGKLLGEHRGPHGRAR